MCNIGFFFTFHSCCNFFFYLTESNVDYRMHFLKCIHPPNASSSYICSNLSPWHSDTMSWVAWSIGFYELLRSRHRLDIFTVCQLSPNFSYLIGWNGGLAHIMPRLLLCPAVPRLTSDLVNLTQFMSSQETKDIVDIVATKQNSGRKIVYSIYSIYIHHWSKV